MKPARAMEDSEMVPNVGMQNGTMQQKMAPGPAARIQRALATQGPKSAMEKSPSKIKPPTKRVLPPSIALNVAGLANQFLIQNASATVFRGRQQKLNLLLSKHNHILNDS